MVLALGKLPPAVLSKYLLGMTGAPSSDLVIPPSVGVDFGVIRQGKGYLVVSSDPVTGVEERIGWYAVNVSANDVATSGNRPRFIQSIILLPQDAGVGMVAKISREMHRTAAGLGITIVGGHTELTPGLLRPIVVTTAFAIARSFITAARPGRRHHNDNQERGGGRHCDMRLRQRPIRERRRSGDYPKSQGILQEAERRG